MELLPDTAPRAAHSPQRSGEKYPDSTRELLASLQYLRDTNPKAVRATVHHYPASLYAKNGENSHAAAARDRRITSWKMTEHMYFNANNPFPTLARGLFTEELDDCGDAPSETRTSDGEGNHREGETNRRHRIVARGYDKFFNIDEVEWTNWAAMQIHTQPPYRLTLKSNGCLILIAALSPSHLVVASKHSLGTTTEAQQKEQDAADDVVVDTFEELSVTDPRAKGRDGGAVKDIQPGPEDERESQVHAEVARKWLKRTLETTKKSEADLAQKLWDLNSTAVLELCDDSFEEHVIATPARWTGLHLHGLNHNTPHFSTASPAEVTALAHQFGFIPTKYVEVQTLDEVKAFTSEVAKTGSWEGDMIEGFVVRSTVSDCGGTAGNGTPPYRAGAPFFFKVKFDEPYLLYRQWREVTRALLPLLDNKPSKDGTDVLKKVRSRIKRPEVSVYADWCEEMMKKEPELFAGYDRGVVRVRERFLAWTDGDGAIEWADCKAGKRKLNRTGKVDLTKEEKENERAGLPKKWVIVPIAVPGCGKTLIGVALTQLFDLAHTQSDDVTAKRTAPTFLKNIAALLKEKDAVYADRNNHIDKHYNELAEIANVKSLKSFDLRLIAIVWDVDTQPYHRVLRICSERVVRRGDNHQTLRPDPTIEAEHEAVVGQFLRNWSAPDPALFDQITTVRVSDSPRETLGKIVDCLVDVLKLPRPSHQSIDDVLDRAAGYKVTTPYHAPARVGKAIRYFGLAPEIQLVALVQAALSSSDAPAIAESAKVFLSDIETSGRVSSKPHVTLVHEKTVEAEKAAAPHATTPGPTERFWDTCKALAESPLSPLYDFDLTHLVWDDRVMAFSLDRLRPRGGAPELVLPDDARLHLHVTVGTRQEDVSAYEARGIVRAAKEAIAGGEGSGRADEVVEDGGPVKWLEVKGLKGEGRIRGMY